jgi:hypothetical protein
MTPGADGPRSRRWLCLAPAALLLPFLGKAFNIDDPFFLEYARALPREPWNPFAQSFYFNGSETTVFLQPQPLGWSFLLALARSLVGESEPLLHLLNVGFALVGLQALRQIAERLGVSALAACWLFAGSSVFLCLGSTIMPYLAWSALSLAAIARMLRGVDEQRTRDLVAAGLLAGGAFLCCFAGVVVIGLLAAYALLAARASLRAMIAPAIGVAAIAACDLWAVATVGEPHFVSSLSRWSIDMYPTRIFARGSTEVALLGAQLPALGLPLVAIALGRRGGAWLVVLALLGSLALWHGLPKMNPLPRVLLWVWPGLALLGAGAIEVVSKAWRRVRGPLTPDDAKRVLLGLWLLTGTFATIRYVNLSAKYMLLPLPAALLLTLDVLRRLEGRRARIGRWALAVSLPLSLVLGSLVALSDYRWAGLSRSFFSERYASVAPVGGAAYYDGEWGMRYYAERAGVAQYRGQPLRSGDRLLYSDLEGRLVFQPCPAPPPGRCAPAEGLRTVSIPTVGYPGPFAILGASAGFYSHHMGPYSYRFVRRFTDTIVVQEQP